ALLEQRGDDPSALDVYAAALDWEPSSRDALRGVLRLTRKGGDPVEIAEAIDRLLAVETGAEAADLAAELAEMRSRGGAAAGAACAMEKGVAAARGTTAVKEQLVGRLTARSAWRKLADLHVADAARREATDEQVIALCTAAHVLRQHAADPRGAADILERAR